MNNVEKVHDILSSILVRLDEFEIQKLKRAKQLNSLGNLSHTDFQATIRQVVERMSEPDRTTIVAVARHTAGRIEPAVAVGVGGGSGGDGSYLSFDPGDDFDEGCYPDYT